MSKDNNHLHKGQVVASVGWRSCPIPHPPGAAMFDALERELNSAAWGERPKTLSRIQARIDKGLAKSMLPFAFGELKNVLLRRLA